MVATLRRKEKTEMRQRTTKQVTAGNDNFEEEEQRPSEPAIVFERQRKQATSSRTGIMNNLPRWERRPKDFGFGGLKRIYILII